MVLYTGLDCTKHFFVHVLCFEKQQNNIKLSLVVYWEGHQINTICDLEILYDKRYRKNKRFPHFVMFWQWGCLKVGVFLWRNAQERSSKSSFSEGRIPERFFWIDITNASPLRPNFGSHYASLDTLFGEKVGLFKVVYKIEWAETRNCNSLSTLSVELTTARLKI